MDIQNITKSHQDTIGKDLEKRNIPYFRLLKNKTHFQVGIGYRQKRLLCNNINSSSATIICNDKTLTKYFLEQCDIPVPMGRKISTEDEMRDAYTKLQKPIVVKPVLEMCGRGITTNINSLTKALDAYRLAAKYKGSYVIAEEHINGHDHRILILDNKCIAGLKRMPPFVIGDGENTIESLIDLENKERKVSTAIITEIVIDAEMIQYLSSQSLTLQSILEKNQNVYIRMVGNVSSGGISENVTTVIHPSIIELCEDIGAYLNMELLGVDIITTDISRPLNETDGKIIEINANPGLNMHTAPCIGKGINTSLLLVDYLYPNPEDAWIEITHDGKLIKTRTDLNKYLENIPKKVIQLKNKKTEQTTIISSPNKSLYTYILDARTVSIDI